MISDIEAALEQRVLSIPNESEIAWWSRPYKPRAGVPYLAVQIAARAKTPIAVGANAPELWAGTLTILVVHPMSDGPKAARARADAVENHFPRGLTLSLNSARVIVETRTAPPPMSAVDWLNYPVQIGWFSEEIPA